MHKRQVIFCMSRLRHFPASFFRGLKYKVQKFFYKRQLPWPNIFCFLENLADKCFALTALHSLDKFLN